MRVGKTKSQIKAENAKARRREKMMNSRMIWMNWMISFRPDPLMLERTERRKRGETCQLEREGTSSTSRRGDVRMARAISTE